MLRLSFLIQAAMFAAISSASAQGFLLTKNCEEILEKVQRSKAPAAFAASAEGKCGGSWDYASTVAQARSRALQWCREGGGKNCRVRVTKRRSGV